MIIDKTLLDDLTAEAKASPRLRMNRDLRNCPSDQSQRMLNAIEPGSELPVHRHRFSSETVVVLRGHLRETFYDPGKRVTAVYDLIAGSDVVALDIPLGQWHTAEAMESGTVILEMKDGPYRPTRPEDIMTI